MMSWRKIIYELKDIAEGFRLAKRLDIFDINYQYGSDRLQALAILPKDSLPKHTGILFRCIAFAKHLMKELLDAMLTPSQNIIKKQNLIQFFVATKNQKDCLSPIKRHLKNSYFAGQNVPVDYQYPLWAAYLLALPFFPLALCRMVKSSGVCRESFRYFFNDYWLIYGYYISARTWLRKIKPSAVILANDHNYPTRIILYVAKEQKISTYYFQHASVSDKFPPLLFDYALLDGIDALEKYERAGPSSTKAFLVGNGKSDSYFAHINKNEKVQTVGVCVNNADRIDFAEQLCRELRKALPELRIILRPHPGDIARYPEWLRIKTDCKMEFSDARSELSFDFLKRVDAVIVGDSNILLEAALLNVFPIYYDVNRTNLDWYGFIKNGLTEYIAEPAGVCQKLRDLLTRKPYIRHLAKRYCATIDTRYDGHSADLSSSLIESLVNKDPNIMKKWRQIPGMRIESYEFLSEE